MFSGEQKEGRPVELTLFTCMTGLDSSEIWISPLDKQSPPVRLCCHRDRPQRGELNKLAAEVRPLLPSETGRGFFCRCFFKFNPHDILGVHGFEPRSAEVIELAASCYIFFPLHLLYGSCLMPSPPK